MEQLLRLLLRLLEMVQLFSQMVTLQEKSVPYAAAQMVAVTGVPQSTWESIIARESNGDHTVASSSGASGLFQTMPG